MPNVLVRDVPIDDLDQIRAAAAELGMSVQAYLRDAVHAQAANLRRRETLARIAGRLHDRPAVSEEERQAVLDAIEDADAERAEDLLGRSET